MPVKPEVAPAKKSGIGTAGQAKAPPATN